MRIIVVAKGLLFKSMARELMAGESASSIYNLFIRGAVALISSDAHSTPRVCSLWPTCALLSSRGDTPADILSSDIYFI